MRAPGAPRTPPPRTPKRAPDVPLPHNFVAGQRVKRSAATVNMKMASPTATIIKLHNWNPELLMVRVDGTTIVRSFHYTMWDPIVPKPKKLKKVPCLSG